MRIIDVRARSRQPANHNRFSVIIASAAFHAAHDAHKYAATLSESYVRTTVQGKRILRIHPEMRRSGKGRSHEARLAQRGCDEPDELLAIAIVELVAVPMPFGDVRRAAVNA